MSGKNLKIALAGNPNSGKTTIFNQITGTRQKVGNWPGVTVEKKEGVVSRAGSELNIIDLPGTYSLTPFSIEEIVARDFILDEKPDVVIDIMDASNLERSLYLAIQLRELGCNMIFALNMADVARARGFKIDGSKLSELLGVPVIFTVGNKGKGVTDLLDAAISLADCRKPVSDARKVRYSRDIEAAVAALQEEAKSLPADFPYDRRWTSVKLLEDDSVIRERISDRAGPGARDLMEAAVKFRSRLAREFNEDPEIVMTDERYGFIAGIVKEVVIASSVQRVDISRNIDLVLTNRFLGFPIFIFFIWAMFQLTFSLGEYPMQWLQAGVDSLSRHLSVFLPPGLFEDFIVNGVVAGVGSVAVFLPNIALLFFCIALFEDTGYMARAAFLMDRIMHMIGLHGKSFIPMLMGFGCNVPAIMAARTLESPKDRILTILITPFMSCSARLPVYIVLAGTFFAARAGSVIFGLYLTGIVVAILTGRFFRAVLLPGQDAPFVMELPPYRVPMLKNLLIHMWDRSRMFLQKMGGVILVGSIMIWILSSFPTMPESAYMSGQKRVKAVYAQKIERAEQSGGKSDIEALRRELAVAEKTFAAKLDLKQAENSYLGRIGKVIEPVFAPIGIDWRGGIALLTGFVAKEVVVSTMGVLYAAGDSGSDALGRALRKSGMTPLSALAMMVFVLLYVPCLATMTVMTRETGALKWTILSVAYSTGLAWIMAFIVYHGGRLLGFA
ncbi:MAG: ferrous iron transport protein B [Deltaproteobacteria bacterium]|nr:ferrous iron transport protein B [Deltaproteobacteria bacterium]